MVLLRAPLGRRGSYLPTGLNILQCLGWSVFELIVIATGASALSKQVLGFGGTVVLEDRSSAWSRPRSRCSGRSGSSAATCASSRSGSCRLAALPLLVVAARPARRARSGTGRARTRSGPGSTSCSRASSRGRRSSPTTPASRARRSAGFWGAGLGYFVPTIPLFGARRRDRDVALRSATRPGS